MVGNAAAIKNKRTAAGRIAKYLRRFRPPDCARTWRALSKRKAELRSAPAVDRGPKVEQFFHVAGIRPTDLTDLGARYQALIQSMLSPQSVLADESSATLT